MCYQLIHTQFPATVPSSKRKKSPVFYGNSYLWVWLASPDNPIFPPDKEAPYPDEEEEISPNPDLPEEEEYLPDEEEINDDPLRKKEIEDPYQPRREEQFPPKKEPGFPQTDPDF